MKFGSEILNKSVPEWRHNNIDYDKLKYQIKTLLPRGKPSAYETVAKSFSEQFEIVNIFISLKIKEISSRILSIESSIINYSQGLEVERQSQDSYASKGINTEKRKLKIIKSHSNNCTQELEKLARFVISQKIATKKLFDKVIKYYPGTPEIAKTFINDNIKATCEYKLGYEGIMFMHLDLDSYLLELSLIFDILNDLESRLLDYNDNNNNNEHSVKRNKNNKLLKLNKNSSSLSTINIDKKYNNKTVVSRQTVSQSNGNGNNNGRDNKCSIDSVQQFDKLFLGESETIQNFLLPKDCIEEFKFILLSNQFQLFNDEILSTSRDIIENSSLRHDSQDGEENMNNNEPVISMANSDGRHSIESTRRPPISKKSMKSMRSFKELPNMKSYNSLMTGVEMSRENNLSTPISLKNKASQLKYTILNKPNIPIKAYDIMIDKAINSYPNIIISCDDNKGNSDNPIIMCHTGGLRDHCVSDGISLEMLQTIWNSNSKLSNSNFSPMDKLIVEWIQSHNLKPVLTDIKCNVLRFLSYQKNNIFLVTLADNIMIGDSTIIPYTFVRLKSIKPISKKCTILEQICNKIIENNIQCSLINTDITIWKLGFIIYKSPNLEKDLFSFLLKDEFILSENDQLRSDEFFQLSKDAILELCSDSVRAKHGVAGLTSQVANLNLIKSPKMQPIKEPPQRIRYWNEFDDGDDDTYNTNQGFYIDEELQSLSNGKKDNGFINLDRDFINSMYDTCERIRIFLKSGCTTTSQSESTNSHYNYGTIAIPEEDVQQLRTYREQDINDSESVYEYRHDMMVSYMYLSIFILSSVTSGITLGIVLALFREKSHNIEVTHETLLAWIIIITLIISLMLICGGLLLLFSRFKLAPLWHYAISFLLFTSVTITVSYGIIETLF